MGYREINDSRAFDLLSVNIPSFILLTQSDAIAILFVFLFLIHAMHLLLFHDMYAYILFAVPHPTIDALFMCILTKLGVPCASM